MPTCKRYGDGFSNSIERGLLFLKNQHEVDEIDTFTARSLVQARLERGSKRAGVRD